MNNKEKYRQLCKTEITIPIFSRDWWMDAVCGEENWDVLLVEKDKQIIGAMPYFIKKKYGFKYITQPKFTQTNGIWIKYPSDNKQKYQKKISYENKIMFDIIVQLESLNISYYQQSFHYSIINWMPFYWKGFIQTSYYTYVIEDISNIEEVINNFSHSKRKNIKKAKEIVNVKFDLNALDFYENYKKVLLKQNKKISYSFAIFKRIYDSVYKHESGRTIYAVDEKGNLHSALFVIWDEMSAYDLISIIDPEFRNSGSASLLVQEIINYVSSKTKKFDFEGSMIKNVEKSFRYFGGIQKPYFCISKKMNKNIFFYIRNYIFESFKK